MTDLIVFDLDGTLVDSIRDIAASVNAMRESYGLPELDLATVTVCVGNGARILIERSTEGTDVDREEALQRMRTYYAEHLTVFTRPYAGVREGLEKLRAAGIKLAVVTNKPTPHSKGILSKLGLESYFEEILGGDSGYPLKPEPDALLALKERFNARNCWMLGDHYTDLEAGRRAGFKRGFVTWGFGDKKSETPDAVFNSFEEFTAAILEER